MASKSITQSDFEKAVSELFVEYKLKNAADVGLALDVLEQKLFSEKEPVTSKVFTGQDLGSAVLNCIRDAVDSGNPERAEEIARVFVSLEQELLGDYDI